MSLRQAVLLDDGGWMAAVVSAVVWCLCALLFPIFLLPAPYYSIVHRILYWWLYNIPVANQVEMHSTIIFFAWTKENFDYILRWPVLKWCIATESAAESRCCNERRQCETDIRGKIWKQENENENEREKSDKNHQLNNMCVTCKKSVFEWKIYLEK